ncbi:MAG: DUF1800 domain-containing protein [Planctomycetota bacterium]
MAFLASGCSLGGTTAGPDAEDPGDPAPLVSRLDAHRFLDRATFGATPAEIARVRTMGFGAWIDDQLSRPASSVFGPMAALHACHPHLGPDDEACDDYNPTEEEIDSIGVMRRQLWWRAALTGEDQLRQRVAFALSQIFVVSMLHDDLDGAPLLFADYHDRLAAGAFGSYRDLVEEVSKNSVMGEYLGMAKNRKADPVLNTRPDENFARELMQLFSIGLSMLNADGSVVPGADGAPVPTYDQFTIEETSRALTGWNHAWYEPPSASLDEFLELEYRAGPMVPWPAFHDTGAKTIVGGALVPAGQSAEADLDAVLDALASHPNVGPFIGKQLIQRLVTSNPSPAYVARISAVWDDDGAGVRGNLGAVVKAILLDPEALRGVRDDPAFGLVREPILRLSAFLRAFDGATFADLDSGWVEEELGQGAYFAPSVFNFFRPDFTTNELAAQGLVSPEMQITTHSGLAGAHNLLSLLVWEGYVAYGGDEPQPKLWNVDGLLPLSADPDALVARIEERLLGEPLPEPARSQLVAFVASVDLGDPGPEQGLDRALEAVSLVLHSPSYTVQN